MSEVSGQPSSIKGGPDKRLSRISSPGPSSDDDLAYQYALRVAYLAYLTQPKVPKATLTPSPTPVKPLSDSSLKRQSVVAPATIQSAVTSHFSAIGDLFKDSDKKGHKNQKFPKELIKVLRDRLEFIVSGRDPNPIYKDRYFKNDLAVFYQALQQPGFRQQFKTNNSKIEDIVLIFLKTSQSELRRAQLPQNVTWQSKLTEHVSQFVGILKWCLQTKECNTASTPELLARLEIYQTKMSSPPSTGGGSTNENASDNIDDMAMVKLVLSIFKVPTNQAQKDISALKKNCTLQAALEDMRNIINHINRGSSFPACKEDFKTEEVYQNWKSIELKTVRELMSSLIMFTPGLKLNEPTESSNSLNDENSKRTSQYAGRRTYATETPQDAFSKYEQQRQLEMQQKRQLEQKQRQNQQYQSQQSYPPYNSSQQPYPPYNSSQQPYPPYNSSQQPYPPYNPSQQPYPPYNPSQQPYPPYNYNSSQQPYPPYNPSQQPYPPYNPSQQSRPYNIPPSLQPSYVPSPSIESKEILQAKESSEGGTFTFIPLHPRRCYKILLNKSIEYEILSGLPSENSDKILSKNVMQLLNECALRWRVSPGFRWLQYLDILRTYYDNEHPAISLDHIKEGMILLKDAIKKREVSTWTISDRIELVEVYSGVHDSLLNLTREALEHIYKIKPSQFDPIAQVLNLVYESELFREKFSDISKFYNDLREIVGKVSVEIYQTKREEIFSKQTANEVQTLNLLAQWIQQEIEKMSKKFPRPIIDQIDVVRLIIEKQVPLLTLDMENASADITSKVKMTPEEGIPVEDIFDLYREILVLKTVFEERCPDTKFTLGIQDWFGPHVKMWLESTKSKTSDWVMTAINVDEFKAVSTTDAHSSSVVDLFTSFNQTVDFIKKLNWPNKNQSALYMTSLSGAISEALEKYCESIEDRFRKDILPDDEAGQATAKQSAWYIKAKTAIASEKTMPSDIKPSSCIMLNNIEAAREQLDKLYEVMEVDALVSILHKSENEPESEAKNKYLYTIKIVLAEDLLALDNNGLSDPYCVLTDELGNRLVETRVIYETLDPRWEEAFDITIEASENNIRKLGVTVWDKDQVGSDDVCGKAGIYLDPKHFDDFLTHDVWLDLDTQGRVLLRISMEGEKDDIRFYFGKAFRTLKRAHDDMARTIIDRMSPFLSQCLSRDVITKLLKPTASNSFTQFFKDLDKSKKTELNDREVETAIDPLFDYFDTNLMTLSNHLYPEVFTMVMSRVWKKIELVIESLILPPLSDYPSDMKPLTDSEIDVVYKWLKFLRQYLHADGNGVSLEVLENAKYHEIFRIQMFYDNDSEGLMQEYLRLQIENAISPKKKSLHLNKSVLNQRNLGTIKKRKNEKRNKNTHDDGDLILRILRMRPGTKGFLKQQMEERSKRLAAASSDIITHDEVPPVPSVRNSVAQ
ncbi:6261_t:CDS:10 [Acaulospora morrowiae]|uniref:6261_t:CDS:1 n=1 Tax=Acaulospora morrowiae TaxID=94023 RepID=A0A9N8VUD8_9GLOM|nr:6261_t:CDS:10 [Acaulospora morrowiae]